MPSTSAKQHRFMEAIARNPSFAKKAGVPQSVGKDFSAADKGKRFAGGGALKQKINRQDTQHGAMDMPFKSLKKFTGMKSGGKVRRFDEGGFTAAETKWLGGADRTDPYILARMKSAVREPAPVEERGIGPKTLAPVEERDINARKPTPTRAPVYDADEEDKEMGRNLSRSVAAPAAEPAASSDAKLAEDKKTAQRNSRLTNRGGAPLSKADSQLFDRQFSGRSADDSRRLDRQPEKKGSGRSADDSRRLDRQPEKKGSGRSANDPRRTDQQPESMAETNAGAVTGRVASRESKHMPSDELKEERGDRGAEMIGMGASMLPVGRVASGLLALKNAAGAAKATTAAGQYIPKGKLNTVYDAGRSLSGTNPRRLAAPPRRLPAPPRRLGPPNKPTPKKPRPDEDLDMVYPDFKKGGKVDTKKPNPFMEMIAKKKAMAKDKKPEMKFAKGGMTRGGMHRMPDGKVMKNSAMNMGGMANMKKGGMPMKDGKPAFMKKMNMGGTAKYAKGGGIESHGKTKGTIIRMASGGSVGSASRRADGIAQRGKTRL